MQESIWKQEIRLPEYPTLGGGAKTDVLIIGGGMAGLLTAHALTRAGVNCLVIDAGRIAGGVTGNTTAKITSQHGLVYQKLLRQSGEEIARGYWEANQAALWEFRTLAGQIPCDFEAKDNYIYAREDCSQVDAELEALFRLKIPAEYAQDLPLPIPTAGAVCFREQAQFHPLKFLAGIVGNLNIREYTRAYRIEKGMVLTNRGRIRAEKIIVATHFPILNRRGLYFMKQYQDRSYVLALEGAQQVDGMYLDGEGSGLSFRNQGEFLLLGGGSHRTGGKTRGWEPLSVFARAHYPGTREVCRWAAQDCVTLDCIPYIGQYSPRTPWLYVATGFNKWGMTSSMVSAMVLAEQIQGRESPWGGIFDPARPVKWAPLGKNAWDSAVNLLTPTRPRCPHLGCALEWNPFEHSWDCPCHGSRFSRSGALLDGPAVKNKKKDRH